MLTINILVFPRNSFEQLCINYANEKLQQQFVSDAFSGVQQEYDAEGLRWSHIKYVDNSEALDLIEGKMGILSLLSEEGLRPGGSDLSFIHKLHSTGAGCPALLPSLPLLPLQFSVRHYAGVVTYDGEGFLAKHTDTFSNDVHALMARCGSPLLRDRYKALMEPVAPPPPTQKGPPAVDRRRAAMSMRVTPSQIPGLAPSPAKPAARRPFSTRFGGGMGGGVDRPGRGGSGGVASEIFGGGALGALGEAGSRATVAVNGGLFGRAGGRAGSRLSSRGGSLVGGTTVGGQFRVNLRSLLEDIGRTGVRYVRCINPNERKSSSQFNNTQATTQLRCSGVVAAVRISRAGYPTHIPLTLAARRFWPLLESLTNQPEPKLDPEAEAAAAASNLPPPPPPLGGGEAEVAAAKGVCEEARQLLKGGNTPSNEELKPLLRKLLPLLAPIMTNAHTPSLSAPVVTRARSQSNRPRSSTSSSGNGDSHRPTPESGGVPSLSPPPPPPPPAAAVVAAAAAGDGDLDPAVVEVEDRCGYQVGNTKVYFQRGVMERLELVRDALSRRRAGLVAASLTSRPLREVFLEKREAAREAEANTRRRWETARFMVGWVTVRWKRATQQELASPTSPEGEEEGGGTRLQKAVRGHLSCRALKVAAQVEEERAAMAKPKYNTWLGCLLSEPQDEWARQRQAVQIAVAAAGEGGGGSDDAQWHRGRAGFGGSQRYDPVGSRMPSQRRPSLSPHGCAEEDELEVEGGDEFTPHQPAITWRRRSVSTGSNISDTDPRLHRLEELKETHPNLAAAREFDRAYYHTLDPKAQSALLDCTHAGLDNPDTVIGCYANQPSDYDRFKPYFSKVLAAVRTWPEGVNYESDWALPKETYDVTTLGLHIVNMRVSADRNLAGFPLPAAMTRAERCALENKMCEAFQLLADKPEYEGRYYSMTPGHPSFVEQGNLMFKKVNVDPKLLSAGIAGDWPYGRGCYVGGGKSFLIWVGEEDHLRIMCVKEGTHLEVAYNALQALLTALTSIPWLSFAMSPSYGHVTSCPSNVGPGLQAMVSLQLPNLTQDGTVTRINQICKRVGMSARGLRRDPTLVDRGGNVNMMERLCLKENELLPKIFLGLKLLAGEEALARLESMKLSHPNHIAARVFDRDYYDTLDAGKAEALLKCLQSGLAHPEVEIGCYANHSSDYDRFSPFFSSLVSELHGVPEYTEHISNWSLPYGVSYDVEEFGLGPVRMRIRVARNLQSTPLAAGMTKKERLALEDALSGSLDSLRAMNEYGGQYYSITPGHPQFIDQEQYEELLKGHDMFEDMAADNYFRAAGIAGDWPYGRGFYMSEDTEFIVFLGGEDHLCIMCLAVGTKLEIMFNRLKEALTDVLSSLNGKEFAFSDQFGFLTSSPANLGTGMRCAVRIDIPRLTRGGGAERARDICDPLGLMVRGVNAGHMAVGPDGTVEISPSTGYCIKERDIVASLYEGVRLLVEAEEAEEEGGEVSQVEVAPEPVKLKSFPSSGRFPRKVAEALGRAEPEPVGAVRESELGSEDLGEGDLVDAYGVGSEEAEGGGGDGRGEENDALAKLQQYKQSQPNHIAAKVFDRAYYDSLDPASQKDLLRCLASGIQNPNAVIGCYAVQPSDYDRFKPFFSKVVSQLHGVSKGATHKESDWIFPEDVSYNVETLGLGPLSMRLRVDRNLADFPLPASMTKAQRVELEATMCAAFQVLLDDPAYGGRYYSITPGHPDFVEGEEVVCNKSITLDSDLRVVGISADWPDGRGCYVSEDEGLVIWVGEEDHLRIMCIAVDTKLEFMFNRVKTAVEALAGVGVEFARSPEYGFVTSSPYNVGTGARALVSVPAQDLSHHHGGLERIKEICAPHGLLARGMAGTVDLSPALRFSVTACDMLTGLFNGLAQLVAVEEEEHSEEGGEEVPEVEHGVGSGYAPANQSEKDADVDKWLNEEEEEEEEAEEAEDDGDDTRLEQLEDLKSNRPQLVSAQMFDRAYYDSLDPASQKDLLRCLASGIENPSAVIGCYANQPSDYDRFDPFFSKMVFALHGAQLEEKYEPEWDVGDDLNCDVRELGLGPLPMRLRVDRNLANFPLPAAMTKAQRRELEDLVCEALEDLQDMQEFGGIYHSLTPGHPDYDDGYNKYNTDMSTDPNQKAAGLAEDWPYGRGCYVSQDKAVMVWVGEEDHVRILCTALGTQLSTPYHRLKTVLDVFERAGIHFAFSDTYGYVASSPYNVGTRLRSLVSVPLPQLTRDGDATRVKEICAPLGLSAVVVKGKTTEEGGGGVVDLSPTDRFNVKERDVITCLYDGLKVLVDAEAGAVNGAPECGSEVAEDAAASPAPESAPGSGDGLVGEDKGEESTRPLQPPSAVSAGFATETPRESFSSDVPVGVDSDGDDEPLASPDDLSPEEREDAILELEKIKATKPDHLAAAAFDRAYYDTLEPSSQSALLQCLRSGILNSDALIGCYANHPSDYDRFDPFFSQIFCELHGVSPDAKHVSDWSLPAGLSFDLEPLRMGPLSMRVRVDRNLADLPLPASMTKSERIGLEDRMYEVFQVLMDTPEYGGRYYSMTPSHPDYVEGQNVMSNKNIVGDSNLKLAGISGDWPYGRGCYVSEDENLVIWVGEEDHLRIMSSGRSTKLEVVYNRLFAVLEVLSGFPGIYFAVSEKYGYVTSSPYNLGTSMRAQVFLQLPHLVSAGMGAIKDMCKPLGLSAHESDGTVDICPCARVCIKEYEAISLLYQGITRLAVAEMTAMTETGSADY